MTNLTRRQSLGLLAGAVIPPTIAVGAAPIVAAADVPPTREELEHYYAFLWREFKALSEEMGVEMHDAYTAHRSGGYAAYQAEFASIAPSIRLKAVMAGARS